MQTNHATKKIIEEEIDRIFSYIKASEDEKEDEKVKSFIKLYLRSGDEIYLYCSMAPISKTYIHFAIAKILSEFTKVGVKVVVNILDISMRNHPIFLNEKERQKILEGETIKELIALFGGDMSNIFFIKQSEIIENMLYYKNLNIISSIYKLLFKLRIPELSDKIDDAERLYGSIGGVFSDVLDYIVAKNLDKIVKNCKKPALIIFSGFPKHTIFKFIDEKAKDCVLSDYQSYLLYLPKLPKIKYGDKYLDIDFPKDKILTFIENWVDSDLTVTLQEESEEGVKYIKNLFKYFFNLFLDQVYFINNNKIEKIPIKKVIDNLDELRKKIIEDTETRTKFVECIVMNFEDCFKKYNKKTHKKEDTLTIYIKSNEDTDILKLLTDDKIKILKLCNGSLTQKEIAKKIGVTEGTVSITLKKFKKIGIIQETSEKKPLRIYSKIILKDERREKSFDKIEINLGE